MRTEAEIFEELEALCCSEGYLYILLYTCTRDDFIIYSKEMKEEDMDHLFSHERLIRTEISTLAGLMAKGEISLECPSGEKFTEMMERTDALMKELHNSFMKPVDLEALQDKSDDFFSKHGVFREAMFYGGESAYYFQFRDLFLSKYKDDDAWLRANRNYSISGAELVLKTICSRYQGNLQKIKNAFSEKGFDSEKLLDAFAFTVKEISGDSGLDESVVENVIESFKLNYPGNGGFKELHDFNEYNATPIIQVNKNTYIALQVYSIAEAFYESPFYWMLRDGDYVDTAMINRGKVTENLSAEMLERVFGKGRVFQNVRIFQSKREVGEVDVLVLFADRAIVVQAKSKKLTLESRKGHDQVLRSDFRKSVQDSYDQGFECAMFLGRPEYEFRLPDGGTLDTARKYSEIYILCVVLDSYPALSFQSRQFLKYQSNEIIQPPLVIDIFFLDVFTEFIRSPLRFLSYLNTRANFLEKISSTHENVVLSYHLKRNLYFEDNVNFIDLGDDFSRGLDLAMMVRRDGVEGPDTPAGILTRFQGTYFFNLLESLEFVENQAAINIGLYLLGAGEETINLINDSLRTIIQRTINQGGRHDFGFKMGDTGIIFHCNGQDFDEATEYLAGHILVKKYSQKADEWFGVLVAPNLDLEIKLCIQNHEDWEYSPKMEKIVRETIGKHSRQIPSPKIPNPIIAAKRKRKRKAEKRARMKHRK